MADDRDTVRRIAWWDVLPALHVLAALRMAVSFRALVLALLGMTFTVAGWQTCSRLFGDTDDLVLKGVLEAQNETRNVWPWERPPQEPRVEELGSVEGWKRSTPMLMAWRELAAPFTRVFAAEARLAEFTYWLLCALWALAVWSLFGGAISRQAAVTFARQENQSWRQLLGFVRPRFGSYVAAALYPMLGVLLLAAFLAVLGLAMRAQWGVMVAGVAWPLVLLAGFMMAFLLVGLFVGFPLMWAAISAEGTDSFGALSHSYSYAYQRPLQFLGYVALAALAGLLGWYLVTIFTHLVIGLSFWGISIGTGNERVQELVNGSDLGIWGNRGLALVAFWNGIVTSLAAAFVFSFFWCASTVIYFLLRQQVDGTELDEVFTPEERQLHGMPPLKTGADGVAEPADDSTLVADR